jgi:hypothetical protein
MKALSVMKTLYISYTTERTTVFMIKHSESKAPMKTSATVKVLREAISKFKKTNIEFLGEFPSTLAISCFHPKPTHYFAAAILSEDIHYCLVLILDTIGHQTKLWARANCVFHIHLQHEIAYCVECLFFKHYTC